MLASYLLIEMTGRIIIFEKGQNISSKLKRTYDVHAIILSKKSEKTYCLNLRYF